MNEQLLTQLTSISGELLEWFKSSVPAAKDFATEQIPLVIQELITYYRVWHTITSCLTIAALIFVFCVAKKIVSMLRADPDVDRGRTFAALVVGGIFVLSSSIGFSFSLRESLDNAVKAWVAPRVFLIEYVTEIVRNNPRQ